MTHGVHQQVAVRTRFALSGDLHAGNAFLAIYNWAYARHFGGRFFLRVNDIAKEDAPAPWGNIVADTHWLGLDWDVPMLTQASLPEVCPHYMRWQCVEDVSFQSRRREVYIDQAIKLIVQGLAYKCFCTKEDLLANVTPEAHYNGRCRDMPLGQKKELEEGGRSYCIRLDVGKVMEGDDEVEIFDLLTQTKTKPVKHIGDFRIMANPGKDRITPYEPTPIFATAVDDVEMNITRVVQGEDAMRASFAHTVLYRAMNHIGPMYASIPRAAIVPADDDAASNTIQDLREEGYLPEAVFHYLSNAGQEIGSPKDFVRDFSISNAADAERRSSCRLGWAQKRRMRKMLQSERYRRAARYLDSQDENFHVGHRKLLYKLMALVGDRIKTFGEILDYGCLFDHSLYEVDKNMAEKWLTPRALVVLRLFRDAIPESIRHPCAWKADKISVVAAQICQQTSFDEPELISALRTATVGRFIGISLFECMEILGSDLCIRRIENVLAAAQGAEEIYAHS